MPIYEYRCNDCNKVSEFLFGVTKENIEIICKNCRSRNMSKIFSKSYVSIGKNVNQAGKTCCGRDERCERPPCSYDVKCER
ncbi:MAG: FmdB family zinc ribbon protein [bacterium]